MWKERDENPATIQLRKQTLPLRKQILQLQTQLIQIEKQLIQLEKQPLQLRQQLLAWLTEDDLNMLAWNALPSKEYRDAWLAKHFPPDLPDVEPSPLL